MPKMSNPRAEQIEEQVRENARARLRSEQASYREDLDKTERDSSAARRAYERAKEAYAPYKAKLAALQQSLQSVEEQLADLDKPAPLNWQEVRAVLSKHGITLSNDNGLWSRSAGASVSKYDERTVEVTYSVRGSYATERPGDRDLLRKRMIEVRSTLENAGYVVTTKRYEHDSEYPHLIYVQRAAPAPVEAAS
jgi:multidrug efflux pump subunit AcrA (membrane-fusion protein)